MNCLASLSSRRNRRAALCLAAALACPLKAAAADLLIEPGPPGPALFIQLYREAAVVAARYYFGLDTADADMDGDAGASLRMQFRAHGAAMRIALTEGGSEIGWESVSLPGPRWDPAREAARAFAIAQELLQMRFTPADRPRAKPEDIARASPPQDWLDPLTEVWALNRLGDAQRGKSPAPAALRRMAADYAWLGFFTDALPGARSRLFFARAFAFAQLCRFLGAPARSETALLLALAGRYGDAPRPARGPQDDPAAYARALALADPSAPPDAGAATTPELRLAAAWADLRAGRPSDARRLLRDAVLDDPLDFWSLARLIEIEDVPADRILTAFYVSATTGWRPALDLAAGRLPDEQERLEMKLAGGTFAVALGQARRAAEVAGGGEIPPAERFKLLGEFAIDAGLKRAELLARVGGPEEADADYVTRIETLAKDLPWTFAVKAAAYEDPSAANPQDPQTLLAQAPVSYGALREARLYLKALDLSALTWRAFAALDDLAGDWTLRLEAGTPTVQAEAARRLEALAPYDYQAFASDADAAGSQALWDAAAARFPRAPGLLKRAAAFAASRVPPDGARYGALLDRWIAADPSDPQPRIEKHFLLMESGRADAALTPFADYPQDGDPAAASLFSSLAVRAALLRGDTERARTSASALAAQDPEAGLPFLAFLFEQRQRFDLAETVLESEPSVAQGPAMTMFWLRTGDPRARRQLAAVVSRVSMDDLQSPVSAPLEAKRLAADALLLQGRWDKAADVLSAVLAAPDGGGDPSLALWLAVCALRQGLPPQTVQGPLQLAAARAGPEHPLRAVFDLYLGKTDAAAAAAALPYDSRARGLAYFFLAEALRAKGDPQAASFYERCLGELFFDQKEYVLSLQALGEVPDPSRRFSIETHALWRDAKRVRENWETNKAGWKTLLPSDEPGQP